MKFYLILIDIILIWQSSPDSQIKMTTKYSIHTMSVLYRNNILTSSEGWDNQSHKLNIWPECLKNL